MGKVGGYAAEAVQFGFANKLVHLSYGGAKSLQPLAYTRFESLAQ